MSDPSPSSGQPHPTGTVTFLFTDVEGSTRLWEQHPVTMCRAMARHDALFEAAVERHGGAVVRPRGEGDSRFAVFTRASDALVSAGAIQQAFYAEAWPLPEPLRVRMALHTGEAELRAGDYYGSAVNRCARLRSLAHGGQTLVSLATEELVAEAMPEGIGLRDLGEHRLRDLARPERVFQLIVAGLPSEFPPLKSLDELPNNLPIQLTSFVGREREMADLRRLLAATRLLTLIGPGGTGKTRLALQVAAEALDQFPDGVWLAELAPLADPELVPQSVATALGLRELPGRPVREALLDFLRGKTLLLILDNCEHLIEASARLAEAMLRVCPKLKLAASSREALGIDGERIYQVPPLSLPDVRTRPNADLLPQYGAVQLFVERALAVQPNFRVTEQNAEAVAQICVRLDGIPLALELAAARLRAFSVEQIAARLDDRFRLLTGGRRTALPRHQTLQALIDWSYDLLSPAEAGLLRLLSVFAGGWTLEAAEEVTSDSEKVTGDVLTLLSHLVDKSLVLAEEQAGGEGLRYRMLETIRQYARDRLTESGESPPERDRHLAYFLQLAELADTEMRGPAQRAWLDRLEVEHDNFRTALEWALEGDEVAALRLAGALAFFWLLRGFATEGRGWLERSLERAGVSTPPSEINLSRTTLDEDSRARLKAQARALMEAGSLAVPLGNNEGARRELAASVSLWRILGDRAGLVRALANLSLPLSFLGDLVAACAVAEEAEALARELGDRALMSWMLSVRANCAGRKGDIAAARALLEESVQAAGAIEYPWGQGMSLMGMGIESYSQGDSGMARPLLERSMAIFKELDTRQFIAIARSYLAEIERREGRLDQAQALYLETARDWRILGHRSALARCLECLAFIAMAWDEGQSPEERSRHLSKAAGLLGAAEGLREESNAPMLPIERVEYDDYLPTLRASLDEATFAAEWQAGRRMTEDQAIQHAQGDAA